MSSSQTRLLSFHQALAPYRMDLFNALAEVFPLKIAFSNKNPPYQANRCVREMRHHQSGVTLGLVGEGPALEAQASRLGVSSAVIFPGQLEGEELYAWYGCGSSLALTSESGTWGAVVNEPFIAGLPVVCTDQAGARVLIDGSNGEVVDAATLPRLSAALAASLRGAAPVGEPQPADLRPLLMTQTFAGAVREFGLAVTSAAGSAGRRRRACQ